MTPEQFKDYMEEMKRQTKALDRISDFLEKLRDCTERAACALERETAPPPHPPQQAVAPHKQAKKA